MFSSEQILEISGDMSQLEDAISFAIKMANVSPEKITYQITDDGKYCLGWFENEDWSKFSFDFDAHIVSEIIKQHLRKQKYDTSEFDFCDGTIERGFLMKAIPSLFSDEYKGIKNPFYGIVSIEPFTNFYAK